ncbi:MAG: hypothetical protein BGN85_09465 [Alphaproteobacteria bacterium 64-11]|jgi:hypothetical protein|nr:MAG: hypothetical protein BGN85_09465 [Alphaproteobacteria bacterium 64-11]
MFNRSQLMKAAWAIYRRRWGGRKFKREMFRDGFRWALRMAWDQAKSATAPAPDPKAARIARLEREIELLPYRSARYDIAPMRRQIEREIALLASNAAA